jgi:hypothetical protein
MNRENKTISPFLISGPILFWSIKHVSSSLARNLKYFLFSPFSKNFVKTKGKVTKSGFIHKNELINLEYIFNVNTKEIKGKTFNLVPFHQNEIETSNEPISFHQVKKYASLFDTMNLLKKNNSIDLYYCKSFPTISLIDPSRFSWRQYLTELFSIILKIVLLIHVTFTLSDFANGELKK